MRTFVSILLLLMMGSLATGVPQFLHLQEHEREDAREEAFLARTGPADSAPPAKHKHEHSEEDCPICQQFHAPLISMGHLAWLIDTGVWVRYVSLLTDDQYVQTHPARISCRGPPTCLAI